MLALVFLALFSTAYGSSSRIVNGDNANEGDFPWQLSLLANGGHICGAAIIKDGIALTAAHCVDFVAAFQVSVDEHIRSDTNGNQKILDINRIIMHPDYGSGAGFSPNDIAILILDDPNGATNGKALPMAGPGANFDGQTCHISGWGVTKRGSLSDVLQWTDGVILSEAECGGKHGSSYNHFSHICIHNSNTGSCNGDSGGPMECNGILAGVTSWGMSRSGRCLTDYPSVYTRVSSFYEWVNKNI